MSSNRFNEYSEGGSAEVSDGSLNIWGYTLKASNLNPNEPLKTNSTNQLVSSLLNISDVVNLQAELNSSIQNPNQSNLLSDGVEVTSGNTLKTDSIEPTTAFGSIAVSGDLDLNNTYEIHNILNMSTNSLEIVNGGDISLLPNTPSLNSFINGVDMSIDDLQLGKVQKNRRYDDG